MTSKGAQESVSRAPASAPAEGTDPADKDPPVIRMGRRITPRDAKAIRALIEGVLLVRGWQLSDAEAEAFLDARPTGLYKLRARAIAAKTPAELVRYSVDLMPPPAEAAEPSTS